MTPTPEQIVAANVKRFREKKGLTQLAASELAGIPEETWNRTEKGRMMALKVSMLAKMAAVLGVELWKLLKPPPAGRPAS